MPLVKIGKQAKLLHKKQMVKAQSKHSLLLLKLEQVVL